MKGWGGSAKRHRLTLFLHKGAFDVCLIQETKKANIDDFMIQYLWGYKDVNWVVKEPDGLSGVSQVMGFLGISVDREGYVLHIVNVYSPCIFSGKKKLWNNLLNLKQQNSVGEWCVEGDVNAILLPKERIGSSSFSRQNERISFNRFVEEMKLIDVPVLGKKFSWFSADGKSMSQIDRFLLSDGLFSKYGISDQWIGDRDISDHCPICSIVTTKNWGPKPFRVINGCL
ncbi:uncharacterized protein LOC123905117 [Trifolium pratense]|uniref:uncharacterized protein LOC123905117 n=1 Tax=Trifolium pratense TaxID=57577 RepID=UPI001E698068|nr:uncharacterized protein LOC123905117 [Trifolium pratense]